MAICTGESVRGKLERIENKRRAHLNMNPFSTHEVVTRSIGAVCADELKLKGKEKES